MTAIDGYLTVKCGHQSIAAIFLSNADNLPDPDVIAAEIAEDLRAALEQIAEIQADLGKGSGEG